MSYLTRDPLDPSRLLASIRADERGGTALFVGTVRPDQGALAIEYQAYEAMAEAELARIAEEAHRRWPEAVVGAQHRLGRIPVGEASVVVASAAPHRVDALDACRFVIEELKRRLPIWKREIYADGSAQWVDNQGNKIAAVGE